METQWPASPLPNGQELTPDSGLAELVAYFYEWGMVIGIILFFAFLLWGAWEYLTSIGNPAKIKNAKRRMTSAFFGVLLLLSSYLILNIINPELTTIQKVNAPNVPVGLYEFQSQMFSEEDMCEFTFTTTQEKESEKIEKTHFMIPGMKILTDDVFPTESHACVPEKDENKILEVRENKESRYMVLVRRINGEEVIHKDEDKEYRVYRYYDKDGNGIEAHRSNPEIKEKIELWCDQVCSNLDCVGMHNLCDYNIVDNLISKRIVPADYIEALDNTSYAYNDGYLENQELIISETVNDKDVNATRRIVHNNILEAFFDTPDDYNDKLEALYAERYEKIEQPGIVKKEEDVYDFLYQAQDRENYNIFKDCQFLITRPEFNRPRCLQLDPSKTEGEPPDEVKIIEWRRKGFASLTKAWNTIGNKNELENIITCPSKYNIARYLAENDPEIEEGTEDFEVLLQNTLGYKRDSSGGGCSIAFYDGVRNDWSWGGWGRETPTCEQKISNPSADMDSYDGIVDRESNCMELIRHEMPLEIPKNFYEITIDRTNIPQKTNYGYVFFCFDHLEESEERDLCQILYHQTCRNDCDELKFYVPKGEYTAIVRRDSPLYYYFFKNTDKCLEKGDINQNNMKQNCLVDIFQDTKFVIGYEDREPPRIISVKEKICSIKFGGFWENDVKYRYDLTNKCWAFQAGITWSPVSQMPLDHSDEQLQIANALEDKDLKQGENYLIAQKDRAVEFKFESYPENYAQYTYVKYSFTPQKGWLAQITQVSPAWFSLEDAIKEQKEGDIYTSWQQIKIMEELKNKDYTEGYEYLHNELGGEFFEVIDEQ